MGTPSVYSHVTTRSSANLRSSRSAKSVKIPWYQKPILSNAYVIDIQRGALLTGIFALVNMIIVAASIDIKNAISFTVPGIIYDRHRRL